MEGNDSKSVSFDGPYIEYHQGTGNTNMGLNDNGNGSIFIHFWAEKRKGNKELTWMVNDYCLEVDNAKRKHRCKMCKILERKNAETKFAKSDNCECNCRYTHLSSF